MKKHIVIIFLVILFCSCSEKRIHKTDLDSMNLFGQVSEINEVKYKLDTTNSNWKFDSVGYSKYIFNVLGMLISEELNYNGKTSQKKHEYINDYYRSKTLHFMDGKSYMTESNFYNSKDYLIRKTIQTEQGTAKVEYSYDDFGKIQSEISYPVYGNHSEKKYIYYSPVETEIWKLNNDEKVSITTEKYSTDSSKIDITTTYMNGNRIRNVKYFNSDSLISKGISYGMDDKPSFIKEMRYDTLGREIYLKKQELTKGYETEYRTNYKSDSIGNWIEKTTNSGGKANLFEKRRITYHESTNR